MVDFEVEQARSLWWTAAVVLFLTVLFIVYSFIGTFVFGLFIYYATRPAYRRIQAYVGQRSLAAVSALLLFALPVIILLVYTVAIAIQELSKVQAIDIGPLMTVIQPYIDLSQVVRNPGELLSKSGGLESVRTSVFAMLGYLGFVGNGLLHLFVMFAFAFYLLRDTERLSEWANDHSDDRAVLKAYIKAVDRDLQNVFFGNILNAIMTGAIGAISFSVLNLVAPSQLAIPYPALTGLLAGVASLIPVVGMKLVYVPVVGYLGAKAAYLETGFSFVIMVFLVSLVIVDSIPDFFLRPYVSGRHLHVGMVMFAYILGPLLFGWYGLILGPLILVVLFHFVRMIVPELITGKPIKPTAVDSAYLHSQKRISDVGESAPTPPTDSPDATEAGAMETTQTNGGATDQNATDLSPDSAAERDDPAEPQTTDTADATDGSEDRDSS